MVTIQLENLGARYGQRTIISGVTTGAFMGGQVVAVVGPNAAGKSTLFKRMAGLIDGPGRVILQGSKKGIRGISYMPQGLNGSARLTVYESVLLARKQLSPGWVVHDDELTVHDQAAAAALRNKSDRQQPAAHLCRDHAQREARVELQRCQQGQRQNRQPPHRRTGHTRWQESQEPGRQTQQADQCH